MKSNADKKQLFLGYWRLLTPSYAEQPEPEYKFHPDRRWRFDWAFPHHKVAVEVDGRAYHVKGGGRHAQDSDREKLNAATALGWRVFRFSVKMLEDDPAGCVRMVEDALDEEYRVQVYRDVSP